MAATKPPLHTLTIETDLNDNSMVIMDGKTVLDRFITREFAILYAQGVVMGAFIRDGYHSIKFSLD